MTSQHHITTCRRLRFAAPLAALSLALLAACGGGDANSLSDAPTARRFSACVCIRVPDVHVKLTATLGGSRAPVETRDGVARRSLAFEIATAMTQQGCEA